MERLLILRAWNGWGFQDWLFDWPVDWSADLSATNNIIKISCFFRQVTSFYHLLEMCKTTTTSHYSSKFTQFIFLLHCTWYGVKILQVLSLLDSTEKVIIWATHVINQHLKDSNVKLFSSHRQQVLDLIFPWFMLLLCFYFVAKCGIALYMLM